MNPIKIVLMEDDDRFSEWIRNGLKMEFGDRLTVIEIETEAEFWEKLDQLLVSPPDLFLLDIRVRWTFVGSSHIAPSNERSDPAIAGIRCHRAIKEKRPDTPIILFSVLEAEDLEHKLGVDEAKKFVHITKSDGVEAIVREIKQRLG
jgi:DNA-binding NarL/FixJ family response regulator